MSPIVVRFGAFGDLVILTPLLHLLHRRYGQPCTLVTSGAWSEPLLGTHPDVQRILRLGSRRRAYAFDPQQWRLTRTLRGLKDTPVYVCDEFAVDKLRWLLARGGVEPGRCLYIGEYPPGVEEHWVDRMLRFGCQTPPAFEAEDFPWRDDDIVRAPLLHIDAADRADCAAWLRSRALANAPLVLLQPGNKRTLKRGRLGLIGDDKYWPTEHWAALCNAIVKRMPEAQVVLCGSPREQGVLDDIQLAAKRSQIHVAAADLPPRRLLALLERAHSMVSIDTGPAHAAAAMGCPLVVLYGVASPSHWKPRSGSGTAVTALTSPTADARVADIPPDTVIEAWTALPPREAAHRLSASAASP
ncbi:glycosyltransferase family 9 protein [Dokdonella soli]|uniref:glycosyltransferase family 9 protein n=1 Tax=Dokdonella soli TaxID=529810 RepID=UPI0031D96238